MGRLIDADRLKEYFLYEDNYFNRIDIKEIIDIIDWQPDAGEKKETILKPCPFCQSPAEIVEIKVGKVGSTDKRFMVKCTGSSDECMIHPTSPLGFSAEEVAEWWNTRKEEEEKE